MAQKLRCNYSTLLLGENDSNRKLYDRIFIEGENDPDKTCHSFIWANANRGL